MADNLPTTIHNRFRLPVHPAGTASRPILPFTHRQGAFFTGFGVQATPEPSGLEYELCASAFGWKRIAKGEKPRFIPDDPMRRTLERDELGDADESSWPVGADGTPLDPWNRCAQLMLVRVQDGVQLVFETMARSAFQEIEEQMIGITRLARDKGDANPIVRTGTRQDRNLKKAQSWWVPTFTITRWTEPDGTVLPPEPEPKRDDLTPAVKPAAEALIAVDGVPPAGPRHRKPRNAYVRQRAKRTEKPSATLGDDLDDAIPY